MTTHPLESLTRRWSRRIGPIMALALAACLPDQGGSYAPLEEGGSDSSPASGDEAGTPLSDAGTTDSGAPMNAVTRNVLGTADDKFVFTDEKGQSTGPSVNKLYVPANSHVHFTLTSAATGEKHTFQITSPPLPSGFASPNITMPVAPAATYDWIAPSAPASYPNAINCDVHKGMVTDLVVQ